MTIIAWDGKVLATDSVASCSNLDHQKYAVGSDEPLIGYYVHTTKIVVPEVAVDYRESQILAVSATGGLDYTNAFYNMVNAGFDPYTAVHATAVLRQDVDFHALIIGSNRNYIISAERGVVVGKTYDKSEKLSIGSGEVMCTFLMEYMCFDAFSAVVAAVQEDPWSGGPIQFIDFSSTEYNRVKEQAIVAGVLSNGINTAVKACVERYDIKTAPIKNKS